MTETLISDVEIIRMLIPSSARAVNILLATPACERIPTPTIDTLTMSSRVETSRAPIFLAVSFKIFQLLLNQHGLQ